MTTIGKLNNAESTGRAHLEAIVRLIANPDENDDAIMEMPLSVDVKSDWTQAGCTLEPSEYQILLSTGGPACRIHGTINRHGEPGNATLQWQDWGTPWTPIMTTTEEDEALMAFASRFIFAS